MRELWFKKQRGGQSVVGRFLGGLSLSQGCWIWKGKKDSLGYGNITVCFNNTPKTVRTHRLAFALAHDRWPFPNALHKCDNPSCARPSHIFEGTQADNLEDMRKKGRAKKGGSLRISACKRGHPRNRYPRFPGEQFPTGRCKDCDPRRIHGRDS